MRSNSPPFVLLLFFLFFFRWDWYLRIVVFCFVFIFGSVGGGSVTTQCMTVGSVGEEGNRTLLGQGNTRAGTKI